MGMENNVMLSYLEDNERFADIFNFSCFEGLQVVQVDDLEDDSTVYHTSLASASGAENNVSSWQEDTARPKNAAKQKSAAHQKSDTKQIDPERARDVKKRLHTGQSLKILAIESQSDVNYLMPWRCMDYDSREYGKQVRKINRKHEQEAKAGKKDIYRNDGEFLSRFTAEDRLNPTYTICVYHGTAPWDGPRTLADTMDFGTENPEMWRQLFTDYPMRLICLNEIEDFSGFHSSAKHLFSLLPYRKDKKKLLKIMKENPSYRNLDEETAGAISRMIGIETFTENKDKYKTDGGYNMCQAMREIIEDSKNEGRADSLALTAKIFKYLQSNPTATNEDIVTACECCLEDVVEVRTALGI